MSDLFSLESRPALSITSISAAHQDEPSQTKHDQLCWLVGVCVYLLACV